jgi:hypothetical protein
MQQKTRRARSRAAPTIDPMTIPAIAPPERPLLLAADAFPEPLLPVAVGLLLDVDVNKFGMVEKTGSTTPVHRPVALDVTQQESVAFSELPRQ